MIWEELGYDRQPYGDVFVFFMAQPELGSKSNVQRHMLKTHPHEGRVVFQAATHRVGDVMLALDDHPAGLVVGLPQVTRGAVTLAVMQGIQGPHLWGLWSFGFTGTTMLFRRGQIEASADSLSQRIYISKPTLKQVPT